MSSCGLAKVGEQAGDHPLRHAPDHASIEVIGRHLAVLAADLEADGAIGVRGKQLLERHPVGGGDFGVED
jgi:hypothetical protein